MTGGRKWSEYDKIVLKKHAQTKTAYEIGVMLGRTKNAVVQASCRYKIKMEKRGENHRDSKLSNLQVEMLRSLIECGFSTTEIHKACFDHISCQNVIDISRFRRRA